MSDLLKETEEAVEGSGHTVEDIKYIGSLDGYSCTWDEFKKLAEQDDGNYYSGFGGQTLASDILIVFTDMIYMKRGEYDGSEWWEFNEPIILPTKLKPIKHIANGDVWASLKEMNTPGGKYGKMRKT